jgi:ABC-type amino acid transport substrate-binding protein
MRWLFILLVVLCGGRSAEAGPLRVGVAGVEPFVIWPDAGPPTGAAIDIWEKVAELNSWQFSYVKLPTVDEGISAVAAGRVDVLVGDTGITRARLDRVEFSQPFFRSGLQIMVHEARPHSVRRLASDLLELTRLQVFWYVVGAIVVLTISVFLFERRHNPDFPKTRREGLAEAFYYVISLALTGKSVYKGFPGVLRRLVMVLWTILGLITVAYVTSSITSAMTVERLTSRITGPQDLPGKIVVAVEGTTGADYLAASGITRLTFSTQKEAVAALLDGRAAAFVDDAPLLEYFDFKHPELPITEVGPVFATQNYGFAFAIGSPLRVPVNSALLTMIEARTVSEILKRYLGPVHIQ